MNYFVDLKHLSSKYADYSKHGIYYGTKAPFYSKRDYCFGYYETENTAFITFIKHF